MNCKPLGRNVVVGPNEIYYLPKADELFLFRMQTQRQLNLMKRYCPIIFVVDETLGINQYQFKLLTCPIIDDNRQGGPVAHLITNKSNAETLLLGY